jgi:formylglycine-generating enzyme required for sulfatase activity
VSRRSTGTAAAFALLLAASVSAPAAEYAAVAAGTLASVLTRDADQEPAKIEAFAMRATPVTNAEFLGFVQSHPEWQRGRAPAIFVDASYLHQWQSPLDPGPALDPQTPVTSVSWFAAQAFCESENARLPSWLEWEYVAAADETHADARNNPAWRARILNWYSQSSSKPPPAVGGPANFYGVRNVHGLIWEWVDDFNALLVSADSRNQGDPDKLQFCGAGAISLQDRDNYAVLMRIALLSSLNGSDTTNNLGFRCVRPNPKEKP